jgi:hypothetical protein
MKSINEQEKIIKDINNLIESNINEGIANDIITFIRFGPGGLLTKKIISKLIDDGEEKESDNKDKLKELEKKKKESEDEEERNKLQDSINKLKDDIAEISGGISNLRKSKSKKLKYKRVVISFKNDVELDIQKLSSPDYKRKLTGSMYFSVVGINEKSKTIDIKTNSFPDTLIIRLRYNNLKTNIDQKGEVSLSYNKYGFSTEKDVSGDEEDVYFKFIKLK